MRKTHSIKRSLFLSIRITLGVIILGTSLLLFLNVVMRYLFLSPIYWAEELARYLMVWLIFLGSGYLAGQQDHISVNIITRFLGSRGNLILETFVNLVNVVFCAALTYYSWRHVMRVCSAHQVTPALEMPMWLAYLAIPAGGALMTLGYVLSLLSGPKEEKP